MGDSGKAVVVRMPALLVKALDQRAAEEYTTKSAVVRQAVARELGLWPMQQIAPAGNLNQQQGGQ